MLMLIQSKARKSVYMTYLYHGIGDDCLFIKFGNNSNPVITEANYLEVNPDNNKTLKENLTSLFEVVLNENKYRTVFLYGNFQVNEIDDLKEAYDIVDNRINVIASIQDNSIKDGRLIIDEFQ
jgi:hypothetical protein